MDETTPETPKRRGRPPMSEEQRAFQVENLAKARAIRDQNREDRINRGERSTPVKKGTKSGISKDIRLMTLTALNYVGGVKYLIRQAQKHNPQPFLTLLGKCLTQDDGSGDKEITFLIQQINVSATPVSGVIASPIAGHIAPPLRLVGNGVPDVEDAKPRTPARDGD